MGPQSELARRSVMHPAMILGKIIHAGEIIASGSSRGVGNGER
jgi:hypothetical protein